MAHESHTGGTCIPYRVLHGAHVSHVEYSLGHICYGLHQGIHKGYMHPIDFALKHTTRSMLSMRHPMEHIIGIHAYHEIGYEIHRHGVHALSSVRSGPHHGMNLLYMGFVYPMGHMSLMDFTMLYLYHDGGACIPWNSPCNTPWDPM